VWAKLTQRYGASNLWPEITVNDTSMTTVGKSTDA
jgi:hypothetical protein